MLDSKLYQLFRCSLLAASLAFAGCSAEVSEIPATPTRIISTAPSVTEILYAIEADDLLVGVTTYCDYPPEAQTKPIIGDFASPNIETVLRQEPDLVIILTGREELEAKFRQFSLPLLILPHESVDAVYESIYRLGEIAQREAQAMRLVDSIRGEFSQVQDALSGRTPKRTLFLVGRNPGSLSDIYAVGNAGYLGELIRTAGGVNVIQDSQVPYPKISIEQILAENPEVIIDMSHGEDLTDAEVTSILEMWDSFPTLTAVQTRQVHVVESDIFLVPGPRMAEAVRQLARIIHRLE